MKKYIDNFNNKFSKGSWHCSFCSFGKTRRYSIICDPTAGSCVGHLWHFLGDFFKSSIDFGLQRWETKKKFQGYNKNIFVLSLV